MVKGASTPHPRADVLAGLNPGQAIGVARMVGELGMSTTLGPVRFGWGSPVYLGGEEISHRLYAEATQRPIDQEVDKPLREVERLATIVLGDHRADVDQILDRGPGSRGLVGANLHPAVRR